jgi:hypothetical protein
MSKGLKKCKIENKLFNDGIDIKEVKFLELLLIVW